MTMTGNADKAYEAYRALRRHLEVDVSHAGTEERDAAAIIEAITATPLDYLASRYRMEQAERLVSMYGIFPGDIPPFPGLAKMWGEDRLREAWSDPDRRPDCPLHPGTKLSALTNREHEPTVFTHDDGSTHGDLWSQHSVPWAEVKEKKRLIDEAREKRDG